jgi:hypothetical protein
MGNQAGNQAKNASNSNFWFQSGFNATGASTQISLVSMRWLATGAKIQIFGTSVGYGATDAYQSTFIGECWVSSNKCITQISSECWFWCNNR